MVGGELAANRGRADGEVGMATGNGASAGLSGPAEERGGTAKRVAVLIPCYNERMTIKKVVTDFRRVLPEAEIYVYDNNSDDGTGEAAGEAGAIVRHEYRQGKGNVIRAMFRDIDADCYVMVDGDDTYPAESAPEMARLVLEKGADMVIGDRLSSTYFRENMRPFHNVGNRLVCFLINRLFQNQVRDIMTGYRAFGKLFVKSFPVMSQGFEIETEMTVHALDKNFWLEEIPVAYRNRPEGSVSKLDTMRDGMRVLGTIATLFKEYRPYQFFSSISLALWLVAALFFFPILVEFFKTGLVPRFPTLIVVGVVATAGILLWICGIILQVIANKHRQLYEMMLNMMAQNQK